MRHEVTLLVESLESRALLSGLTGMITTDQSVYEVGRPIEMTYTLTNTSSAPQLITVGPSNSAFVVSEGGQTVWRSNPGVAALYLRLDTLDSGQSLILHATWDGSITSGASATVATGTFVVTNELDAFESSTSVSSATFTIDAPQGNANLPNNPPAPPPASSSVAMTVTPDHATNRAGAPVRIRIALKNNADTSTTLSQMAGSDRVVVWEGSTVIWTKRLAALKVKTLKQDQTVRINTVWNGKANQGGSRHLTPGLYTIEVDAAGLSTSSVIRIR